MADMGGRIAVGFLKSVGKIIAVVEAASKCNLAYRPPRLVYQHFLRSLQAVDGKVFRESEAGDSLEES